ncbi:MAG TPA: glycosyltransferase family 39 protein [Candidatus Dormibacteraeota bacterium]
MGRSAAAPLQRAGATRGRIDLVAIAGLTLGVLTLGLYRADTTSLWTDELFTLSLASKPLPVLMRQLWSNNANMSLYYLVLSAWLHIVNLFGLTHPTEWLIRLPSIVFAAGALIAAYYVGKRLFGVVVGLVGAVLLLLNYVFLMEVAQARAYSLELFLQLIGWYLFIRILENPGRKGGRMGLAFGAVMALAVYADLYTGLVLFAQLAAFLVLTVAGSISRERAREALRPAFIAALTITVSVAPLALDVLSHGAANEWIATPGLREVLTFAGAVSGASPAFALALIVGGALGLSIVMRRPQAGESGSVSTRAAIILVITWIAVPFVLSWGLSQHPFGQHLFITRYLIPIVPAICLLSAAGLYSISRTQVNVSRFMLVAAVLLAVSAVPEYYSRVLREDFRTASVWLTQHYQNGDGVACASTGCAFAMEYYAPDKLEADAPGQYVFDAGNFDHLSVDPATLATYAHTHNRIFLIYGTAGQSVYIRPDEEWFQAHNYRLVDRVVTVPGSAGTVTVELWAPQD